MPSVRIAPITKATLRAARRRGEAVYASGAASAHVEGDHLILIMRNGAVAGIDLTTVPYPPVAKAPRRKRSRVELSPLGDYVWFPGIDDGYSVPALLDRGFGSAIRSHLGKLGGAASTPAKARAARRNGRKGGRPKAKHAA